MATIKKIVSGRASLPSHTAHNSLGAGAYISLGVITHNTVQGIDDLLEVTAVAGASVSGGKQLLVFAKQSLDGTNYSSGPESGSSPTDEQNLFFIGAIPLNSATVAQTGVFSFASAYDGNLPYSSKIIVKNDSGATLGSSGNSAYVANVTSTVA